MYMPPIAKNFDLKVSIIKFLFIQSHGIKKEKGKNYPKTTKYILFVVNQFEIVTHLKDTLPERNYLCTFGNCKVLL